MPKRIFDEDKLNKTLQEAFSGAPFTNPRSHVAPLTVGEGVIPLTVGTNVIPLTFEDFEPQPLRSSSTTSAPLIPPVLTPAPAVGIPTLDPIVWEKFERILTGNAPISIEKDAAPEVILCNLKKLGLDKVLGAIPRKVILEFLKDDSENP